VGLLTGDDESEVKHVFLALDLTETVLDEAIRAGADMIVTHHPMIFSGIKKINNHSFTGRKIISLVRHGISYYAMHTNYDILGMADLSAGYLELSDTKVLCATGEKDGEPIGFGRVGNLPCEMTLKEYALLVKKNLKLREERLLHFMQLILERKRQKLEQYSLRMRAYHPQQRLNEQRQFAADAENRLRREMMRRLEQEKYRLGLMAERLKGLSPLEKLSQGYAYVENSSGANVRTVSNVKQGEQITVYVTDGRIRAEVTGVEKEET